MANHHPQPRRQPLIVVTGATGTGKSKLAVALASRFNGEIINADAMQMYRGLPVITNKIPEHEREGVEHHMLDFIGLEEKPWTVKRFVQEARGAIEGIRARGKVPVVVGGTGYYVHGLLVKESLLGVDEDMGCDQPGRAEGMDILQGSAEEMYKKLMELDPKMARSWHPRDKRRVQRSLEICLKTGRKASEVYRAQAELKKNGGGEDEKIGLNYDTLLLWLEAEDAVLKERLNKRVDAMVEDGLFDEVLELAKFEHDFKQGGVATDKTKGIWVSIGYKELEPWVTAQAEDISARAKDSKVAFDCIESVKAGTRQYAKRQNRYIRIRLANALKEAGELDKLFLLDSTDLGRWEEIVEPQAQQLVSAFLEGCDLPQASTLSDLAGKTFVMIGQHGEQVSQRVVHRCEVCDKTLMTETEWQVHLASRSHKNVLQAERRKALKEQYLATKMNGATVKEPA